MARQVKLMGSFIRRVALDPQWTVHVPTGVSPPNLVRLIDFKGGYYVDNRIETTFAAINTFTRSGVTWDWQMVGSDLELVEIADGDPSFSVDPVTGLAAGITIMPSLTRENKNYVASVANMESEDAGTFTDLALNALGQFNGVKIESAGLQQDGARFTTAGGFAAIAATPQAVEWLVRENENATCIVGVKDNILGDSLITYTFATNTTAAGAVAAGTFSDIRATLLVDGTHRITAIFTPVATRTLRPMFVANSFNAGEGFTALAFFAYNKDEGVPLPILGTEGATHSTNAASLTGLKSGGATASSMVVFAKNLISTGNHKELFDWRETGDTGNYIKVDNHTASYKIRVNHSIDADVTHSPANRNYNDVLAFAASKAVNDIKSGFYSALDGLVQNASTPTQQAFTPDVYGVGCTYDGTNPIGAVIEKVLLFDVALTADQLAEAVQV